MKMRVINSAPKIGYPLLPLEAITGSSCIKKKKKNRTICLTRCPLVGTGPTPPDSQPASSLGNSA